MFDTRGFLTVLYNQKFGGNVPDARILLGIEQFCRYMNTRKLKITAKSAAEATHPDRKRIHIVLDSDVEEERNTLPILDITAQDVTFKEGYPYTTTSINFSSGEMRIASGTGCVVLPSYETPQALYFSENSVEYINTITESAIADSSVSMDTIMKLTQYVTPDDKQPIPSNAGLAWGIIQSTLDFAAKKAKEEEEAKEKKPRGQYGGGMDC